MTRLLPVLIALLLSPRVGTAADPAGSPDEARAVFKQFCYRCHSGTGSEGGDFDVLDVSTMTTGDEPLVRAGEPDSSYLYERMEKGSMPPKAVRERPSAGQVGLVKAWIAAGAKSPTEVARRTHVGTARVLTAVRDHLRTSRPQDRPYLKFFTLAHLHNNPAVTAADLRTVRAALSKAINSMHWQPRIVVPGVVPGSEDAILAVDIRDLNWDKKDTSGRTLWQLVQQADPYALRYDTVDDEGCRSADLEIVALAGLADGDPLPIVRADWFVATATRPPLYHALAQIPHTAGELERRLNVDVADNFRRDRLARAGFAVSGVSRQNRLVERHDAAHGAYWKSYDFLPGGTRANLVRFPLGPAAGDHPYPDQAFEHDGGEAIFHLPNHMLAYMLLDGKDRRIDVGPIKVVGDSLKTSGTSEIVNGLSCMACHKHGMIRFTDTIRDGAGLFGAARLKVRELYPEAKTMDELVEADADRFMAALDKACRPFLEPDSAKGTPLKTLTDDEPVAAVARMYLLSDVDLATAAYELDVDEPAVLKGMIAGNKRLVEIGLRPLAQDGGRIKREDWEKARLRSVYQMAASELGKGTPWVGER